MTNKYQEALDATYRILFTGGDKEKPIVQVPLSYYEMMREALQAGAEGRILPKLPEGWLLDQVSYVYDNDLGMFCYKCSINVGGKEINTWAATIAQAMQNAVEKIETSKAVDKIGGAV